MVATFDEETWDCLLELECGAVADQLKEARKNMIRIQNIRGRPPERPVSFRHEFMWQKVEYLGPGRVHVRLEHAQCPAFWIEFELVTQPLPNGWGGPGWAGGGPCAG